jgi:hypothetical protein
VLADDHLDIDLANFVRGSDGTLHYVDREWRAEGGVDLDLAVVRALWNFAYRLIDSGTEMPWTVTTTVDELTVILGALCGFAVDTTLLDDWRTAEDSLQELVCGLDQVVGAPQRVTDGQLSRAAHPVVGHVPFTTLRRDVLRLREEIDATRREATAATDLAVAKEHELETARNDLALAAAETDHLRQQLDHHHARASQFERRFLVRVYRLVLRRRPPV